MQTKMGQGGTGGEQRSGVPDDGDEEDMRCTGEGIIPGWQR